MFRGDSHKEDVVSRALNLDLALFMATTSGHKVKRSKAIPIITPNNVEQTFTPLPKPSTVQGEIDAIISASASSTAVPDREVSSSNKQQEIHNEGDVDWGYDIYAHSFVPNTLKIINSVPAVVIDVPEYKQINFRLYIDSFTASAFLPPTPPTTNLYDDTQYSTKPPAVSMQNYEMYFKHYLQEELYALQKQCNAKNLYAHPATATWTGGPTGAQSMIHVVVPGLREDEPLLFPGDLIYVRQLRLNSATGLPLGMEGWLKSREQGHPGALNSYAPGFTGYQHNARVQTVLRAQETLILEVSNFVVESAPDLRLNVIFPVQHRLFNSIAELLPSIQEDLKAPLCYHNPQVTGLNTTKPPARLNKKSAQSSPISPQATMSSTDGQSTSRRQWIQSMLFPDDGDGRQQTELNCPTFKQGTYDRSLNFEQLRAIHSMARNDYGDVPYLVSGPPGTGKTKTLVETALQLLEAPYCGSILVCAPSDAAADILLQRLAPHLNPEKLLRLNSPARTFAEVPNNILMYCFSLDDAFGLPSFKVLMNTRIIVTTCRDASILCSAKVTNRDLYNLQSNINSAIHPDQDKSQKLSIRLHWSALLIDEAAQATEPETLVPLSVVASPVTTMPLEFRPQFIMAGDEYQLGPRTASHHKEIRTSLFARLFRRSLYQDHPLARCNTRSAAPILTQNLLPITRPPFANLIRNYRSHPSILALPSSLYYFDTLEPEAKDTEKLMSWEHWKGRKWPVLFAPNTFADEIERDGGGWYNLGEARLACNYAQKLVESKLVEQEDICIMSPFSAQVKLLRKTIRENPYQLWGVNIGPTEAFQGLESRVVIICTTRSKKRFLDQDVSFSKGLVNQPQRMNVALTRAKHGLIVLGNREILREDDSWKAWMAFCERNGLVDDSAVVANGVSLDEGDWEESPDKTAPSTRDGTNRIPRLERMLIMQEEDRNIIPHTHHQRMFGSSKDESARSEEIWAAGIAAEQAILHQQRNPEHPGRKEVNTEAKKHVGRHR
ncbi:P-loop containing nucleoside triphosphate hydrolase protein [Pseudovirgaria hyperparasitica]|uniref:P-loop containing nucleoside triphosphate hydrolase protein n=1 Tax=Pseudovirgaria hyperparasitica TaxID=470096 RepID=A0A6A6W517_9PEZI|nr:P-loop containing nucleoside triphosphate hydrolase protein [Pseudovirgaria hyperparasitica]KAF2757645.1 P-loop containing nucleoside triphosphate hydrolase protein [Pseudovirgaria hyperparasitica]